MIYIRCPARYRVFEPFAYKLYHNYNIAADYHCPYFTLTSDNWLVFTTLYAHDGATWFPDFEWIITPSAIHDALHQCIKRGVISESFNDTIDDELSRAIEGNPASLAVKRQLLKLRAWYVKRGTNLVNEHKASEKPFTVPRLKNQATMAEYQALRNTN